MVTRREKERRYKQKASAKRAAEVSTIKQSRAFTVPEGTERFFLKKAGDYVLNVVAFESGENIIKSRRTADPGYPSPCCLYYAHSNVGPNKDVYGCNAMNWGEPCPVCDYRAEKERDGDLGDDEKIQLSPSKRQLWLVEDVSNGAGKLRVWDYSNHGFGRHLFDKTNRRPEYDTFSDPDEGYTLLIGAKKSAKFDTYFECTDIEFKKREPIEDSLFKQVICLEDCIENHPYDELRSVFLGAAEDDEPPKKHRDDEDDDDKPVKNSKKDDDEDTPPPKKKVKEEVAEDRGLKVGDTVKHSEFGVCLIVKISGDGTSLRLEDKEGDLHNGVGPEEVTKLAKNTPPPQSDEDDDDEDEVNSRKDGEDEDLDDDEDDEPPPPKRGRPKKPPVEDMDDDEDEDLDNDEDDTPPAKKRGLPPPEDKEDEDDIPY
jgi:hypothetical protein